MDDLVTRIKEKGMALGFSAVGICDAAPLEEESRKLDLWLSRKFHGTMEWMERTRSQRVDPRSYFPEAKSIVVVAVNYFRKDEPLKLPQDKASISIYARGRDYHKVIRKKLKALLKEIQQWVPGVKGRVCVDSFPIMEKSLAVKAGLGWIGKHTNLILKSKGSYFFLGELLLNISIPSDTPFTFDHCGSCHRCQEACPTDALSEAYVLDSRKCISYLTIEHKEGIDENLKPGIGNWVFGCDICQIVCPWNKFSESTQISDFHTRIPESWLPLERLEKITSDEFEHLFQGTPVKRAGYENFKRNVGIALTNYRATVKRS
ncbi:MAG: tRNA epoxyqueuosine(34) reductase QueG [Calditrichaeota bacterium]|nr:MAG: tRNA epoxyqueuosine(34) reductase QueG [Calditrichota bacterium]